MKRREIESIYASVYRDFPIPHYMEPGGEGESFVAEQVLSHCPQKGRLLDIGSGALDKAGFYARLGFECYACDDYSDPWHRRGSNLDTLQSYAQRQGITLHIHENGDYTIPFSRSSFDVVCLFDVIEHLHQSPRDILNAAGDQLKAGGILVVTMPNSVNFKKRLRVLAGLSNYPDVRAFYHSSGQWRGHVREYTLAETRSILEMSGFAVVAAHAFDRFLYTKISSPLIRGIAQGVMAVLPTLRDSLLLIARKPADWAPALYSEEKARDSLAPFVPSAVR